MRLCFALFELWAPHGPLHDAFPCRPSARVVVVRFYGSFGGRAMSALGQKQTYAMQKAMSALPPIATAKADIRKRSCPLYPRKQTFVVAGRHGNLRSTQGLDADHAVQLGMSALGHKRTHA